MSVRETALLRLLLKADSFAHIQLFAFVFAVLVLVCVVVAVVAVVCSFTWSPAIFQPMSRSTSSCKCLMSVLLVRVPQ